MRTTGSGGSTPRNNADWQESTVLEAASAASDNEALIDITLAAATPTDLDPQEIAGVMQPRGAEYKVLDLEDKLDRPRRKRGRVDLVEQDSLVSYVLRHKTESTCIYANPVSLRVDAVLNDHAANEPGWGDHLANLAVLKTPAWVRWLSLDGKIGDQLVFAQHIERNAIDIIHPAGADMLEIALSFEASNEAKFSSAQRLNNGQRQFHYHETIEGTAGKNGQFAVPDSFTIRVAPFEGGPMVEVLARLRYRVPGGKLSIGYELDNAKKTERDAFDLIVEAIGVGAAVPLFMGSPPVGMGGT